MGISFPAQFDHAESNEFPHILNPFLTITTRECYFGESIRKDFEFFYDNIALDATYFLLRLKFQNFLIQIALLCLQNKKFIMKNALFLLNDLLLLAEKKYQTHCNVKCDMLAHLRNEFCNLLNTTTPITKYTSNEFL